LKVDERSYGVFDQQIQVVATTTNCNLVGLMEQVEN
jgi:hypothetical protein